MSMSREHSTGLSVQGVIHHKWTDTLCSLYGCSGTKVVSDSLWPHRQHQVTLLCSLLFPGVCLISCPSSRWHYLTISSSATPFSSCLQSFPASGSFPMSWLFISSGQIIEASASATVLPMNIQDWLPLKLMVLISFLSRALWRVFSSPTITKCQFFDIQTSLLSNSHICTWLLGKKNITLIIQTFVSKMISLLFFNILSRFAIAFLPKSKCLLISWLQSSSTVILKPKKAKFVTVANFLPSICHEVMGLDAMIFIFLLVSFKLTFLCSSFTLT